MPAPVASREERCWGAWRRMRIPSPHTPAATPPANAATGPDCREWRAKRRLPVRVLAVFARRSCPKSSSAAIMETRAGSVNTHSWATFLPHDRKDGVEPEFHGLRSEFLRTSSRIQPDASGPRICQRARRVCDFTTQRKNTAARIERRRRTRRFALALRCMWCDQLIQIVRLAGNAFQVRIAVAAMIINRHSFVVIVVNHQQTNRLGTIRRCFYGVV